MLFGPAFRQAQVPEWSSFYITYDQLKDLLKIAQGRGQSAGEAEHHKTVHGKLKHQCCLADQLYKSECDRLENTMIVAISTDHRLDRNESGSIRATRLHLAKATLFYMQKAAQRLLLFAQTNREAASRMLKKLDRVGAGLNSTRAFVSQRDFFDPKRGMSVALWALEALQEMPDGTGLAVRFLDADADKILKPFLAHFDEPTKPPRKLSPRDSLNRIIQLAGFDKSMPSGEDASKSNAPENISFWMHAVLSQVQKIRSSSKTTQRALLFGPDDCGRSPLHYAAEHGLSDIVSVLLQANEATAPSARTSRQEPWLQLDACGLSPLCLAVGNRHSTVVDMLLSAAQDTLSSSAEDDRLLTLARIALDSGDMSTLKNILTRGMSIDRAGDRALNMLHIAARQSSIQGCLLLLEQGADVDVVNESSGRTALAYACINGDMALVKALLKAGASPNIVDSRGWTPQEHAAYRGHLKIVELLDQAGAQRLKEPRTLTTSLMSKMNKTEQSHTPWKHEDYGHFDGEYVWITPGSIDATTSRSAVQISDANHSTPGSPREQEVVYSLRAFTEDDPATTHECSLPILRSMINEPWLFRAKSFADMKLVWKLFSSLPDEAGRKRLVGSGIIVMGTLNAGFRPNKESLVRDTTVALQDPTTSAYVGSVTFTFFRATPHPPPQALAGPYGWRFGNGVGGHRGSGKNRLGHRQLQIGENTAQSFLTAIEHGASFIEFDVQLTKDLVPVVYHDLLLSETGTDTPMHTLSFEQFEYMSQAQGPRRTRGARANSLEATDNGHLDALAERMAHTHFNKITGFKANTRGNFIHERSSSLDQLFQHVDKSVGLNIELKYPMLFEADEWDLELLAIRTDIFVDTVLDKVYQHAQGRTIVFSSFNPEICIALSTKQRSYPVFFLSKTSAPRGELRSCCIQQAIHFAKSWGLPGIVTECTPLIKCPRLIQYIKSAGLACMSFGAANSDPDCAKTQFEAGIDAVITDTVGAIVRVSGSKQSGTESEAVSVYP